MGDKAVSGSAQLALDTNTAVEVGVSDVNRAIRETQAQMFQFGEKLVRRLNSSLGHVSTGDTDFLSSIKTDQNQVAMQLMMAKSGVHSLLSSWADYADVETEKFKRMNRSDSEFLAQVDNRITSTNTTSGGSLRSSAENIANMNDEVLHAAEDYLNFRDQMRGGLEAYRAAVSVMNQTSGAGIQQVKEMAFNFNANDNFIDKKERDDMLSAIGRFEKEMDDRAKEAEQTAGVFLKSPLTKL
jgi:hypothetical protein